MLQDDFQKTVARMKDEIMSDVRSGRIPASCASFSDLDDCVDANEYGGFCDDDLADEWIKKYGGRDTNEAYPDGYMKLIDESQRAIDTWLKDGGIAFSKLADLTQASSWSPQQQGDFNAWFARSMIHQGAPLVLFRGTAASADLFPQTDGWYGRGIYFTDNSMDAQEYAIASQEAEGGVAKILPVFLRIEKPYLFTERDQDAASNVQLMQMLGFSEKDISAALRQESSPELIRQALEAKGHDGLVVQSSDGNEYVAFSDTQVLRLPRGHQAVVDALGYEAKTSARQLGFEMVRAADPQDTRAHIGPIVGATGAYFIQSTGRASAVIHDKERFAVTPELGGVAEVRYDAGRAVISGVGQAIGKAEIER